MKRRNFLKTTAATAVGSHLISGIPMKAFNPTGLMETLDAEDDRILIVVQLFGGNDGLNTIIPVDDPEYYKIRPDISVPKADAVKTLSKLHLHPALVPSGVPYNFQQLIEDGRMAVIHGVGYENPNLSHFRSTDIWLSGFNSSNPEDRLIYGWLGKYWSENISGFPVNLPAHPIAVQIGGTLSMLFHSSKGDVGIALTDAEKFFALGHGISPDYDMQDEGSRYGREFNFVRLVAEQTDRYSTVVKEAYDKGKNMVQYADNGFVRQLGLVARLISGGLKSKVFMVYMGGFDTHVSQQNDTLGGLHPYLLESLSTGIGQFMEDAIKQGFANRVAGLTVSEFGRRPQQNGSWGTDHGAASLQFVFGNRVNAGVFGNQPSLTNLNNNGDLIYEFDYRRIYTDILQTWFGATNEQIEALFGESILPLEVLQKPTSVADAYAGRVPVSVRVYPNPSPLTATLEWNQILPGRVSIDLYGIDGRLIRHVYSGWHEPGIVSVPVEAKTGGTFLCALTINGLQNVVTVTFLQ